MKLKDITPKTVFFLAALFLLFGILFQMFSPFLNIIVVALIIVQMFHPFYRMIKKAVRSKIAASLITTILAVLFVIVPLISIFLLAANEVNTLIQNFQNDQGEQVETDTSPVQGIGQSTDRIADDVRRGLESSETQDYYVVVIEPDNSNGTAMAESVARNQSIESVENAIYGVVDSVNGFFGSFNIGLEIPYPNIEEFVLEALNELQKGIGPAISALISSGVTALFFGFILIISLLYLFGDYDKIPAVLEKYSPLENDVDKILFKKFKETTVVVIIGTLLVAVAQATSVSIALALLGVGAPVLLWILMVILSVIPVGSGLVWFPIGIALMINGQVVEGVVLIAYSAIIINVVDALLRPFILKGTTRLHPLVIILSVLGGIAMFGPLGILYGPLIVVLFVSLMEVYNQQVMKLED